MDFECESCVVLKKGINGNQRAPWKVEEVPCGDDPPYLNVPISSLLNKLLMKRPTFIEYARITFTVNLLCKLNLHAKK
jgi:hypothetical protein